MMIDFNEFFTRMCIVWGQCLIPGRQYCVMTRNCEINDCSECLIIYSLYQSAVGFYGKFNV